MRRAPMAPVLSRAARAAGGRVVVAGSQMTRRAAKGRRWAVAMEASSPDSRSTAVAPVVLNRACLALAVAMGVSVARRRWVVGPPSQESKAGSAGWVWP